MSSEKDGRLFVVATPIGCMEDITLRALRVLKECELILAEDTRHTRKLCARHEITTRLKSLHEHTRAAKIDSIVNTLLDGERMALVSDAGTPLISDPGRELLALATQRGVAVEVIPGPSAVTAALSVSGIPFRRFAFEGFLPRSGKDRKHSIDRIVRSDCAVVFFESPHRIQRTLHDFAEAGCTERQIALCRELTKTHEEVIRGTVAEVLQQLPDVVRGEVTLVLAPIAEVSEEVELSQAEMRELVQTWQASGLRHKEMTSRLREQTGWNRDRAYQAVLAVLEAER